VLSSYLNCLNISVREGVEVIKFRLPIFRVYQQKIIRIVKQIKKDGKFMRFFDLSTLNSARDA